MEPQAYGSILWKTLPDGNGLTDLYRGKNASGGKFAAMSSASKSFLF